MHVEGERDAADDRLLNLEPSVEVERVRVAPDVARARMLLDRERQRQAAPGFADRRIDREIASPLGRKDAVASCTRLIDPNRGCNLTFRKSKGVRSGSY
jgi:hypothetical protein